MTGFTQELPTARMIVMWWKGPPGVSVKSKLKSRNQIWFGAPAHSKCNDACQEGFHKGLRRTELPHFTLITWISDSGYGRNTNYIKL